MFIRCVLTVGLLLAGCSSDSASFTTGPVENPAPVVARLELSYGPGFLTPDVTAVRVTSLLRDGQEVTAPQTFPAAAQVSVPLETRARAVRIEYLSGDQVVGTGLHNVQPESGRTVALTNPLYERGPQLPALDDREGEFGGGPMAAGSPLASPAPSPFPLIGSGRPLALLPQHLSSSRLFGHNVTLPSSAFLPTFPPVGQQGTGANQTGYPGTCIAWSYGYGVGSYAAAQNPDLTLPANFTFNSSNVASPMALYEMAILELGVNATGKINTAGNFVACTGSYDVYLPFMVGYGSATLSQVAYVPSATKMLSGANTVASVPRDASLSLGGFGVLLPPRERGNSTPPPTVDQLKQFLVNGQPIAFATEIWNNFVSLPTTAGVYYGSGCAKGGHGMVIVGYNDDVGAPGQKGAFLVQNSFNTTWPDPGFYPTPSPCPSAVPSPDASPLVLASPGQFYLAYSAFNSTSSGAAVAYPVQPSPPAGNASLGSAYQVTAGNTCILVFNHWFPQPLLRQSVTVTDPQGNVAVNPLEFPLRNGYTHVRRTDGQSFLSGTYRVNLATSGGNYTGNVTVGNVSPGFAPLPAAAFPSQLIGTTGVRISVSAPIR